MFTRGFIAPNPPSHLRLVRDSCMTPLGDAVLDYADQLDQTVLEMHVIASSWHAEISWRRHGKPVAPAQLEPTYEGLVAQGYLQQTPSGYALTPAGEAIATGLNERRS
jgi:hypothetical protein